MIATLDDAMRTPLHIMAHTREMMIEQIMHMVGGSRAERARLESLSFGELQTLNNKLTGQGQEL